MAAKVNKEDRLVYLCEELLRIADAGTEAALSRNLKLSSELGRQAKPILHELFKLTGDRQWLEMVDQVTEFQLN